MFDHVFTKIYQAQAHIAPPPTHITHSQTASGPEPDPNRRDPHTAFLASGHRAPSLYAIVAYACAHVCPGRRFSVDPPLATLDFLDVTRGVPP